MNPVSLNDTLNRLLILHKRSLPVYLSDAPPWWSSGSERAAEVCDQIASDHLATVDRLGRLILDNGGTPASGEFPLMYTAWHDLSFDFLLSKIHDGQKKLVAAVKDCVERLAGYPEARAVAEETLGQARAHLDMLSELRTARVVA